MKRSSKNKSDTKFDIEWLHDFMHLMHVNYMNIQCKLIATNVVRLHIACMIGMQDLMMLVKKLIRHR
jgi:hypothetical protein